MPNSSGRTDGRGAIERGDAMNRGIVGSLAAAFVLLACLLAPVAAQLKSGRRSRGERGLEEGARQPVRVPPDHLAPPTMCWCSRRRRGPRTRRSCRSRSGRALRRARARYIDRLWLVIDNNPSPISAIFTFTPQSGRADIETRVRIDEYTHVRAIAETNDGQLYMTHALRQGLGRLFGAAGQGPAGRARHARAGSSSASRAMSTRRSRCWRS